MDQGQEASPTTLLKSVSVRCDPDPKPVTVSVGTLGKLKPSRWMIRPQTRGGEARAIKLFAAVSCISPGKLGVLARWNA